MINIYYKEVNKDIEKIDDYKPGSWINLINPTKDEIKEISEKTSIPIEFLNYPLDIDERARVEIEDDVTLTILRIPYYDKNNDETPFITLPLGIIFIENYIVTVCVKKAKIFSDFIKNKIKKFKTTNKNHFLLLMFLKTASLYLHYLRLIDKSTDIIENELHKSMKNEELIKLLNIEKSLVYFTTSLRSNEFMMERLQKSNLLKMNEEDKDLLDDVIIENKQAIEMANIHSNILSGMMDAFASVISNNLNVVMKFLTSITIILMIPTLIASIYGMNIKLPFQKSPHAFLVTMSISFILTLFGIILFIKRKWL